MLFPFTQPCSSCPDMTVKNRKIAKPIVQSEKKQNQNIVANKIILNRGHTVGLYVL